MTTRLPGRGRPRFTDEQRQELLARYEAGDLVPDLNTTAPTHQEESTHP